MLRSRLALKESALPVSPEESGANEAEPQTQMGDRPISLDGDCLPPRSSPGELASEPWELQQVRHQVLLSPESQEALAEAAEW